MTDDWPVKAYRNQAFIDRVDARPLRILAEYLEPQARFDDLNIADTIVFFGSARIIAREEATRALKEARAGNGGVDSAERRLALSGYYEDARELARRLTEWSKGLEDTRRRFVVCTGGGPGIMEAANRGASEAKGINIGLNISIPEEQHENPHITRELAFEFHYFFMRKFWFTYLAKAQVIFPGGFGTMDEFFELMTLVQTRKLKKKVPIVVYGSEYWDDVLDFDAMVRHGVIDKDDLDLIHRADTVDDAYQFITGEMTERFLDDPGGRL